MGLTDVSPQPSQGGQASDHQVRRRRLGAAARRQAILKEALPLFAIAGYEQARMSDLAALVGVTEPVIFQNFGTKANLFAATLEQAAADATVYLQALADASPNVLEWLGELLAADHLDRLHTAPMFGVLFAEAHQLQLEASVGAAVRRSVAEVAELIAQILERGQSEGSIRPDVSPLTLSWLVVSLIQARQFRRGRSIEPSATLEHDLLVAVLNSLGSRR
jgi:AcrR family transcriptional regulator